MHHWFRGWTPLMATLLCYMADSIFRKEAGKQTNRHAALRQAACLQVRPSIEAVTTQRLSPSSATTTQHQRRPVE